MAYKTISIYVDEEAINEDRLERLDSSLIEIFGDDLIAFGTNHQIYNKD